MHVNNEIGSINDIFEIAKAVKSINKNVLFHSDCSQSVGKLSINLQGSAVDFISFSGHKIECIRGIAAIIFKKNLNILPIVQSKNPAMTAAFAKAVKIAVKNQKENFEKVKELQKILIDELKKIENISTNSPENNLPFIVNFSVLKHKSETILRALSAKEIYISTVSACSSKTTNESYVIKAITNDEKRAKSSLRVSLSSELSGDNVLVFVRELKKIIENL
jgi:cysteine desulfurase